MKRMIAMAAVVLAGDRVLGAGTTAAAPASDGCSRGGFAVPGGERFWRSGGGLERVGGEARVAGECELPGVFAIVIVSEAGRGAGGVRGGGRSAGGLCVVGIGGRRKFGAGDL